MSADPAPSPNDGPSSPSGADVVVFWRPGCGFCGGLLRAFDRVGLAHERRNIWEDDEAAAWVRAVTGGSETVPTVRVGDRSLVNPGLDDVLAALADVDPGAVPESWTPREPGRVGRTINRLLGG